MPLLLRGSRCDRLYTPGPCECHASPWTPWDELPEDTPDEVAENGPKLRAKAQALVAAVLPRDEEYVNERMGIARRVFAALDAAWTARVGTATAQRTPGRASALA